MNDTTTDTTRVNGQQMVQKILDDEPMSAGYRPTLPAWTFWNPNGTPILFLLRDIELMLLHPAINQGLLYYKAGIAGAEFEIKCENTAVSEFLQAQLDLYWDRGVPKLQAGYEYGWIGAENVFDDSDGIIKWDGLLDFCPRDSYLLTNKGMPVGVRVKNVADKGYCDLWLNREGYPSKGLWYSHRVRFGNHYGRSQCMPAWMPWKRLAWKDGAESIVDGAIMRVAYAGPAIRYPPEDMLAPPGTPGTTNDSQGRPRKYARDTARQMAEQLRTGGGVVLSSEKWPAEQGGHFKWEVEWPDHVLSVDPLLNYIKYLIDQIYFGIGVPPELIQAAETGSGYSGRAIPLESFLAQQQHIADTFLMIFVQQVLKPLVNWNFGPVKFDVKVKSLLQSKNKERNPEAQQEVDPATGQTPYVGPEGGHGYKDANGNIHYDEEWQQTQNREAKESQRSHAGNNPEKGGAPNAAMKPQQAQKPLRAPVAPLSMLQGDEGQIVARILRGMRAA